MLDNSNLTVIFDKRRRGEKHVYHGGNAFILPLIIIRDYLFSFLPIPILKPIEAGGLKPSPFKTIGGVYS